MNDHVEHGHDGWSLRAKIAFGVFAAIAAFLLIAEHRAHVVPFLPWIFLAACPLMHLFMHRGHGGHAGHRGHAVGRSQDAATGRPSGTDLRDDATGGGEASGNLHSQHGGRP
jgi:hypothetical protein